MTAFVTSFYAYKGGVGRSMAVANAAVTLARWGFRTLCMDWDLDSPGLHQYFAKLSRPSNRPGIVELIAGFERKERPNWRHHVEHIAIPNVRQEVSLMRAGILNETYSRRMQERNLAGLYEREGFDQFLEGLLEEWRSEYDAILVDVRSGISDVVGIGTVLLPDILVALYTSNHQTLDGSSAIAMQAVNKRYDLPIDRGSLLVVPVFSKADVTDPQRHATWVTTAAQKLRPFYGDWASRSSAVEDLIIATQIPYESRWAYEENLPALEDDEHPATQYHDAIAVLAALLAHKCGDSDALLSDPGAYQARAIDSIARLNSPQQFAYDVFMSFPGEKRDFARLITAGLQDGGLSVFFDEHEIAAGEKFSDRLEGGLGQSRHLLAVIEPSMRAWQRAEISYFFSQRSGDGQILPILMPGVGLSEIPWFLHQYSVTKVDAQTDPAALGKKLASGLRRPA